jgi:hypothetical protein
VSATCHIQVFLPHLLRLLYSREIATLTVANERVCT